MKRIPLWVDLRQVHVQKRLPYLHAIRDCTVEAALADPGDPHMERRDVPWRMFDGDTVSGDPEFKLVHLATPADQAAAMREPRPIIVDAPNWKIVPLENLISERTAPTYAWARSAEEAAVLADVLDVGVDGIVLVPERSDTIVAVHKLLLQRQASRETQSAASASFLQVGVVTEIRDAGTGDRVAVDTTSELDEGEGLLVGGTARAFALVLAETRKTQYIPARPFRINAGSLQSYLYAGGRTCYLSEVEATSPVLAIHPNGVHRVVATGRAKIERRPHSIVRWRSPSGTGFVIVQTAETVCLATPAGAKPVTQLRVGNEIWVHHEASGRHAGKAIPAAVTER